MEPKIKIKASSGNVFADIGLPHPDEELAKADLALEIYQLILERGLTSETITRTLHIEDTVTQSLINAEPIPCSLQCLQDYLSRLQELSPQIGSASELIAA